MDRLDRLDRLDVGEILALALTCKYSGFERIQLDIDHAIALCELALKQLKDN